MPINPDAVGATSDPVESSWTSKDCLLYALGVGAGAGDPTGFELEFTTENSSDVTQRALPTFAVVAASGVGSAFDTIGSFNPFMLVHGEQGVEWHAPLPVEGHITTVTTIVGIYDKGSGAVIAIESVSTEVSSGRPMFINRSSIFLRGEGGWGGERGPSGKAGGAGPVPRPSGQLCHPGRPGAAVPAVGRPQPAAFRSQVRRHGRIPPTDPARAVYLRVHRPGAVAHPVRLGPRPSHFDGRTVLEAGAAR